MALFNEKDARAVHTLTQIYQLETEEELQDYFARWPELRPGRGKSIAPDFAHLWRLVLFVKDALDVSADKTPFDDEWWQGAQWWLMKVFRPLVLLDKGNTGRKIFTINDVRQATQPMEKMTHFETYILDELYSVFLYAKESNVLRRCAQCNSVFLVNPTKPEMLYCSDRCGNRARVARHAKKS